MTIKLEQKKKSNRRICLGKNRRETLAGVFVFIGMCFLIVTLILWGISELAEENFIISEMFGAYSSASMCLCFGLVFIGLIIGTRNWLARIFCLFIAAVMLTTSYSFMESSILLYKDKEAFENKQYEKLVAIPIGVEFDDPDYGTQFLMELEFNDLTIDVYSLNISRSYYQANLSGKPLEIAYLPNSHFAVSMKEYLGETGE